MIGFQPDSFFRKFVWAFSPCGIEPEGDIDEEEFTSICKFLLKQWKILPIIEDKFLDWASKRYLDHPSLEEVRICASVSSILAKQQFKQFCIINQSFISADIPSIALKSSALRVSMYDNPYLRSGCDIDLAVGKANIEKGRKIIQELGFQSAQWCFEKKIFQTIPPEDIKYAEMDHYELVFLVRRQLVEDLSQNDKEKVLKLLNIKQKGIGADFWNITHDGELTCFIVCDLHHGITQYVDADKLIEDRQKIIVQDQEFYVPNKAWLLLHFVLKVYWEGVHNYKYSGIYQYVDICRLVPLLNDIEIDEFLDLCKFWKMETAAFYVIRRLQTDFNIQLDTKFIEFLNYALKPNPESKPDAENDRGDMWQKLFGYR